MILLLLVRSGLIVRRVLSILILAFLSMRCLTIFLLVKYIHIRFFEILDAKRISVGLMSDPTALIYSLIGVPSRESITMACSFVG